MYKVSEVAEMLSIEKVKIFEALIIHDDVLSPYVIKKRHISFLTEDGVRKLEKIIYGTVEVKKEEVENVEPIEPITIEEDYLEESINKVNEKKDQLKNEIIDLKRQINNLDKELRMKDEAILHYQGIFEEDIQWILEIEKKIEEKRQLLTPNEKKSTFFSLLKK